MNAKIIAVPVAAGLALGGATLATGEPKEPPPVDRPALAVPPQPAIAFHGIGGPLEPFGLHREIAEDMAKELGLPADRVADAMRKAIAAQFDRRRDEALKCFDDRKQCDAARMLPPFGPARAMRVRPGRPTRP